MLRAATPTGSAGAPASARDWQRYADYLGKSAAAGRFSGAVLVAKNWKPLLNKAYGKADRKRGIANTPQTKFCIASMGKMFTGVAIAQLVEQGKLSFKDTIGKYLSGFPADIADRITIDELLTHTSGLDDVALRRTPDHKPATTLAGQMAEIVKEPLQSEPGSQTSYSNDGFIVLGAIIERVSGQSYADYIRDHVFKPAGMTHTAIRNYRPSTIPNMAHAYVLVGKNGQPVPRRRGPGPSAQPTTLRENDELRIANPSGGAYSTVGDLLAFAKALISHKLLSPSLTTTVLAGKIDTHRPGAQGEDKNAYGFGDRKINGARIVGHNGGSPGFEAQLDVYPDKGYTVVILTNQDDVLAPAIRASEDILTR